MSKNVLKLTTLRHCPSLVVGIHPFIPFTIREGDNAVQFLTLVNAGTTLQCRALSWCVELLINCQLLGGAPAVVVHGVCPGHWIVPSVLVARGGLHAVTCQQCGGATWEARVADGYW